MILKKKYFIFLAVLLVAMMSVAVAADVNDSTTESITPTVTHTTDNVDTQTATQASNEITKKINETSIKESVQNTPKTVIVDSTNYSTVFLNDSLSSTINDGDTIDVQGDIINTDLNITINKAINLTTTTGATIYLNTTGGNLLGTNPGNSFKIVNSGSYTNVTNLKFYNTQVFVINAHHVTMDNINVTVENRTVGSGVGVTSIRDNSTYVTVKNSNFYTKNNGGSSSVVLAWADYCTIDNNNITGEGNVGNLMYLTTYNIAGVEYTNVNINTYNNITNNRISTINLNGGSCVGVVVSGNSNKFEGNNISVASSFSGQWISPTATLTGDFNDTYEGNSYINNDIYGSFTGTKNSTIMGNTFNKTVSLPERCIFKNNNAENFTVTVRGSGCDLCGNRMYHLTVNSGVTNTMVCIDNVFLNGYEGNFTWYMHSTSSGLNKMMYRSVKAEGEPTVIEVNEDNFYDYFSYSSDDGILRLNENNIPDVAIYNINYFPSSLDIHRLYFQFQNMMTAMNKNITIIGKTNITLNNAQLLIDCPCLYFELSNFNFKYDNDYTLEGKGQAFQLDNMDFFGKNAHAVLNNITMNYTHEYSDDDRYTNPVVIKKQTGCSFIIQNSEFNINIASNSNSYGIEILGDNTQLINNTINVNELYSVTDSSNMSGVHASSTANNLIFKDNTITVNGESTLYGLKLDSNTNTITNNNITVTTTGTANGVELTGNDNTVTDNYILANNAKGDAAVVVNGENNVVKDNIPSVVITENSYSTFFDENSVLREEYNGEDLFVSGLITGKVFIFDGVNVTITNDGTAELKDCQIMVGNDAQVVFDGLVINNEDMEAILLESSGNVINNSEIIVTSAYPLHAVEIAEDGNIITNTIITATIASADVAYDKDYVGLPQSSALYISSNNNLLDNVTVSVDGTSVAEGSYYPSIDAIDFQSTGKGVVIENNTITNSKVIATGSNYVYGINVGRAKDTTIENVNIDVDSDYYTNAIQLFDAVDITIDGTIDSTAATQAYGVYATAMAVGTSSGIDLTGLNITVESPDATGVLIEGASDVIIADATYDIQGGNTTAVNAHVDWMGNIPKNINITEMDIKINGTEDNNILYFGLCDGVTITECNIETTSGSEINFNKTSNAQVTNNYILIKDMMTGSFGNYAVITTENDTTVENNTPTSKLIDELNQQIEDLQNELDQLKAPKATTLTLDPVTDAKYNTNITITGTLVNEDSIGLYNQVVTLTIGEKTVDVTTKGGVFEYTTSFKTLEEQTVTATYAGTDKYNASEDTITFTLEKGDVIVTVDEIAETAYGDNVTITGKFTTSDGKAISNSNVKITIDGKKYYAKTDKTGTYTLSVKATTVGENTITAGYSGNTNYNAYETTATFNVVAADAIVTYEPISDVTLGENVTISGTFTDANGKAVTNSNVKITINGKKYYAKTDSTGKYTLSVATTKEGVNNVTIGYSGSAKYNAFETSTTFTVLKAQ